MRLISHHLVLLPLRARYQLDAIVEEFRPRLLDSVVWIFYDFVSLHQYIRDEYQDRLFRRALSNMYVMYSHDAVEVHRIEMLTPENVRERCVAAHGPKICVYWEEDQKMTDVLITKLKRNQTPYEHRGWCRSEKEWSALRTWMKGENPVPLPPAMFRAQMQQMEFTHRKDSEEVFNLQAKVFLQKATSTTNLLIENLDEDKIAVLFAALPFYTKLKELVVRGSPENAWKAALGVVESGACNVEIACETVRDEDAIAFAADLSAEKFSHLQQLHLKCETIGELGRQALEQMMTRRRASLVISIPVRSRGHVGQGIEPAVASEACVTLHILISKRRQPPRPAEAMAAGPAQAEDTSASGPLQSVPQHAEAGRPDTAQQTVSVHCLAGSSFELEVNSAETGWDVAVHIASRTGHPAETLVLTSGGCVIDQHEPLLHQVQHGEITYVVQKLGAGRAARSLQRLLEEKTLSDTDVAALNETVSLTWRVNQSLQGIQLPSRPAELDVWCVVQPEPGGHPATQPPAEFDVWPRVQPELGGHPTTQQPAEFDVWRQVQPELGWHPTTQQPAEFDVWVPLQPEPEGHPTTQQPAEFDVWGPLQPEPEGHPTTQQPAELDVWPRLRPEPGGHPTTQQPAEFDVWGPLQPEPEGHPTTQQPAEFDV